MTFGNAKEKSIVRNKDCKRSFLRLVFIIVLTLMLLLPLIFLVVFNSEKKSSFWFIDSNMSVSDWFGFWISYISMLITAFLTYRAYIFSRRIEDSQFYRQLETDKSKYRFSDIYAEGDNKLKVVLPMDVISLDGILLQNAYLEFGGGEKITLIIEENCLSGFLCTLIIPPKINPNIELALTLWRQQMFTRTKKYFIACLTILFSYKIESITENKQIDVQVCSKAQIVVYLNDEKEENYKILDTAISSCKMETKKGMGK